MCHSSNICVQLQFEYLSIYNWPPFMIACVPPGVMLLIPIEYVPFCFLCQKLLWLCTLQITTLFLDCQVYPNFILPQKKKFNCFKLGDQAGHGTSLPLPVLFCNHFCWSAAWTIHQNVETLSHVVSTFTLLFQKAHSLNKVAAHFLKCF